MLGDIRITWGAFLKLPAGSQACLGALPAWQVGISEAASQGQGQPQGRPETLQDLSELLVQRADAT